MCRAALTALLATALLPPPLLAVGPPRPEPPSALAYLPGDAEVVLSQSNVPVVLGYGALAIRPAAWVGMGERPVALCGLFRVPAFFESPRVTVAAALPGGLGQLFGGKGAADLGRLRGRLKLQALVIETSAPLGRPDLEALRGAGVRLEEVRHRGRSYYRPGAAKPGDDKTEDVIAPGHAALAAGPRTVVYGPEKHIKALLEQKGRPRVPPRLAFLDPGDHVTVALVRQDKGAWGQVLKGLGPPAPEGLVKALRQHARGAAAGVTLHLTDKARQALTKLAAPAALVGEGNAKVRELRRLAAKNDQSGLALLEVRFDCDSADGARAVEKELQAGAKAWGRAQKGPPPKGAAVPAVLGVSRQAGSRVVAVKVALRGVAEPEQKVAPKPGEAREGEARDAGPPRGGRRGARQAVKGHGRPVFVARSAWVEAIGGNKGGDGKPGRLVTDGLRVVTGRREARLPGRSVIITLTGPPGRKAWDELALWASLVGQNMARATPLIGRAPAPLPLTRPLELTLTFVGRRGRVTRVEAHRVVELSTAPGEPRRPERRRCRSQSGPPGG